MMFLKLKLKRLRRESAPDPAFKAALRARLVAPAQPVIAYRFPMPVMRYAFATSALALVLFFGLSSYAYASSAVGEGDALYPVKAKIEEIEGGLKKSPEARARFRARMLDRRIRETVFRIKHNEPLPPQTVHALAHAMNMSVDELRNLSEDEEGRTLIKTELKLQLVSMLTKFRVMIELSDMEDENKDRYLRAIDIRLERIQQIPTTTP